MKRDEKGVFFSQRGLPSLAICYIAKKGREGSCPMLHLLVLLTAVDQKILSWYAQWVLYLIVKGIGDGHELRYFMVQA